MYEKVEQFRVLLNNLVEDMRKQNVAAFVISGLLAEQFVKCKDFELAEMRLGYLTEKTEMQEEHDKEIRTLKVLLEAKEAKVEEEVSVEE